MKWVYFAAFLLVLSEVTFSQSSGIIFPNLKGQELCDSLVTNYRTSKVLSYDPARDTLFAKIYNSKDSVTCVYTGYTIYIDPKQSPASYAYSTANFQIEHTWPQSKGAEGQAKSDMHHLYPVWGSVNASRGDEPFKELEESTTQKWWYLNHSYTSASQVPQGMIDKSSKRGKVSGFEPREDHKGNVARAMFYFYTMYRSQSESADPNFFNEHQREVLYKWHKLDPVDSLERVRNNLIAFYQEGFKNPFILDSTLIRRAYFSMVDAVMEETFPKEYKLFVNYPNPFNSTTTIRYQIPKLSYVRLQIYDVLGREIRTLVDEEKRLGSYEVKLDGSDLTSGVYFYKIIAGEFVSSKKFVLMK